MKKELKYILSVCLVFGLYFVAKKTLFADIYWLVENNIHVYPLSFFISYFAVGVPVLIFMFITSRGNLFAALGLSGNFLQGIIFSLIFSLPMFIGYGISANFQLSLDVRNFWFMCVFAAFFEEFYYRGFFFGQIFRNSSFGFFPSLILSALVFASLHLYQSGDPATLVGIFLTTFLGAGLFAWLYVEWNYNLWLPVGLHFFMNLSWEMFAISENALGDLNANLFRGLTILLAVAGTVFYKKYRDLPIAINRQTLLMKKIAPKT